MEHIMVERREAGTVEAQSIVRQAVLLQSCIGTRSAVEYLKANRIHGAVIGRVLSGGEIRQEDRQTRDAPRAWD